MIECCICCNLPSNHWLPLFGGEEGFMGSSGRMAKQRN